MAEFDPMDFLFNLYQLDQSNDANDASQNAVNQGYLQQNPFSPYQPAMAAGFMDLLSNPGKITETPGYQFAYDQGLQSLFSKQASTGNRFSGRALTESMQFGQGLASQMYNSEIDRYATWAGANQTQGTGGVQTGQNLSSLNQQNSFNQGHFWQTLWDQYENTNQPPNVNDYADQYTGGG